MKRKLITLLLVLCVVLTLIPSAFAADTDTVQITGERLYSEAFSVLDEVNVQRAENGLPALTMDPSLLETAMLRAAECAVRYGHTRPDDSSCFTANDLMFGENIAAGYGNAASVMNGWMNSSGHRANILRDTFETIGVGAFLAGDTIYWVQCFGLSANGSAAQRADSTVTETVTITGTGYTFRMSLPYSSTDAGDTQSATVYVLNSGFYDTEVPLNNNGFLWSSSNNAVASVSNGTVTSRGGGTAAISAGTPGGSYQVSADVKVTAAAPVINSQPGSISVAAGDNAVFSVQAAGSGLTYQWYYKKAGASSWSKWNGHTTASTSAPANASWDGMQVHCVVTDSTGQSVTSNSAWITILPRITSHPANVTVAPGESTTFAVKATGSGLSYQWYYKKAGASSWSKWNGRTTASTTPVANDTWNGMQVRCVVTSSNGNSVTSNAATVTITSGLRITSQPANLSVFVGDNASFSVKATGSNLKYQWYYKKAGASSWSKWNGHTTATTTAPANATWNGMQVRCVVTDGNGKSVTSASAAITIKPKITTQPKNITVSTGKTASFTVKATGCDLSYQWYYKKAGASAWSIWKGHTTPTTTAPANASWNGMQVRCVVTDGNGTAVTSAAARITIQ